MVYNLTSVTTTYLYIRVVLFCKVVYITRYDLPSLPTVMYTYSKVTIS